MKDKKLGIPSAIATGVGLILATSCLLVIGQGTGEIGNSFMFSMIIALLFNMFTALSVSELDSMMPQLTGGLAQYTLVGLGPFISVLTIWMSLPTVSGRRSSQRYRILFHRISSIVSESSY